MTAAESPWKKAAWAAARDGFGGRPPFAGEKLFRALLPARLERVG